MTNWQKLINDATENWYDDNKRLIADAAAYNLGLKRGAKLPNELLLKAIEGLEFYRKLHSSYLSTGGLFNPELMVLSGDELANIFIPANKTLDEIRQALQKETK